jgi:hypothetical protein
VFGSGSFTELIKACSPRRRLASTACRSHKCLETVWPEGWSAYLQRVHMTALLSLSSDKFKSASPLSIAAGSSVPESFSGESMIWQVIDT